MKRWKIAAPKSLAQDALSGAISALVTIAYCVSFSALLFQGPLQGGLGMGLAALLTGSALTGAIVALFTTIPPVDAGPDTPAIAVMSVLAGTVSSSIFLAGGSSELAVRHVLLAISAATFMTGIVLTALGSFRLGQVLRFVPYPVVGGFLAASGWLLATGAIEVVVGRAPDWRHLSFVADGEGAVKLALAVALAGFLLYARKRYQSYFILPGTFLAATLALNVWDTLIGLGGSDGGWFLGEGGALTMWFPLSIAFDARTDWGVLLEAIAEIGAVSGVTAIALLLDVSSLEVARARGADLDGEFRINGIANALVAFVGGVGGNLSLQASILIEEAGGVSRFSGLAAAATIGAVLASGLDVVALVPTPLLGGLLIYLGAVILSQALLRSPARRSFTDTILAVTIMAVIVWFGYLVGVVAGILGACVLFAVSYSRIGVVRRHLTRAEFASNVERSLEQSRILREEGRKIHVFWLAGYVFFGSGNGVFEFIRSVIDRQREPRVRFVVLDFKRVSGFDTSATLSLVKLRNHCEQRGVVLNFAALDEKLRTTLDLSGFFRDEAVQQIFGSRNDALEWCEDRLLAQSGLMRPAFGDLETWLGREIGVAITPELIRCYFERREVASQSVLYREGDSSQTIDLVVSGGISIMMRNEHGEAFRLRRMSGNTVVGEMGFFRSSPRAASVVADEATVVYSLRRESFDNMVRDDPDLAAAFMRFIVRVLADRVEFANREIAALS